jgi:hypothetical protein
VERLYRQTPVQVVQDLEWFKTGLGRCLYVLLVVGPTATTSRGIWSATTAGCQTQTQRRRACVRAGKKDLGLWQKKPHQKTSAPQTTARLSSLLSPSAHSVPKPHTTHSPHPITQRETETGRRENASLFWSNTTQYTFLPSLSTHLYHTKISPIERDIDPDSLSRTLSFVPYIHSFHCGTRKSDKHFSCG